MCVPGMHAHLKRIARPAEIAGICYARLPANRKGMAVTLSNRGGPDSLKELAAAIGPSVTATGAAIKATILQPCGRHRTGQANQICALPPSTNISIPVM
ncbi:hypothetical protein AWB81_04380 [Caballeronia arationis]|jgi:hypothetical protein|nr:hypothetical protein AWB81_04380 [Caballeronia arationis]